jgi:hypothetical protein
MRTLRLAGVALSLIGCVEPLEAPSAYESQRYLCSDEYAAEWQDLVDQCHEDYLRDRSCAGVASFEGTLQSKPVTVESRLTWDQFGTLRRLDDSLVRDGVKMVGQSPYFEFRWNLASIGGAILPAGSTTVPWTLEAAGNDSGDDEFDNDRIEMGIRLASRNASVEITASSGTVTIESQTEDEEAAHASVTFRDGSAIDGCFIAFPIDRTVSREDAP